MNELSPYSYDALAEMRRSIARFQAEMVEYNFAIQAGDRIAMDYTRGMLHAYLDHWLDATAKAMKS